MRLVARARSDPALLLIPVAFVMYATYGLADHVRFRTYGFDLGLFDQVVWLYSRFELPYSTLREMVHLGDHFAPILALLAPFYWLHPGAETLLVLQAALSALAAIPVYLFARARIGRALASVVLIGFLCFVGIENAVSFDFHPAALAPFFIGWAMYFALERRYRLFWPSFALALLVQEDVSLILAGLGAYLAFTARPRWIGATALVASLAYFVLAQFVLMPYFARMTAIAVPQPTPNLDIAFGATPGEALAFALAHPKTALLAMFDAQAKRDTQTALLASWSGLPLLSPLGWLSGLPQFASRFLSLHENRWALAAHYGANIAPTLAFSTVLVCEHLLRLARRAPRVPLRAILGVLLLAGVAWTQATYPAPLYDMAQASFWDVPRSAATLEDALRVIPPDAAVGAQNPIFPHLSDRPLIQLEDRQRVLDYLVYDTELDAWPATHDELVAHVRALATGGEYTLVVDRDPVFLLRRAR